MHGSVKDSSADAIGGIMDSNNLPVGIGLRWHRIDNLQFTILPNYYSQEEPCPAWTRLLSEFFLGHCSSMNHTRDRYLMSKERE